MVIAIKQKSLHEIFNERVKLACKLVPERMDKFILVNTEKLIYEGAGIDKLLKDNVSETLRDAFKRNRIEKIIEECCEYMNKNSSAGIIDHKKDFLCEDITVIAIDENVNFENVSAEYTQNMKSIDNLNHELAHLFDDGSASVHRKECFADAMMALNHKQMFGNSTDFINKNNYYSDAIILGESSAHYTNIIIQKVEVLSEELAVEGLSLKDLSPEQTLELAFDLVDKYSFKEEVLANIVDAYKPVADYYKEFELVDVNAKDKIVEIIADNQEDHDICRAGMCFLYNYYLEEWFQQFELVGDVELDLAIARDIELGDDAITADVVMERYFNLQTKQASLQLAI